MELEIIKKDGKTFLLMPDELVAELKSNSKGEARLAEAVKPKDEEIARLKEEVRQLESPEHAQEVFVEYAKKLTPEGFVGLASVLGYEAMIPEASVVEVAEAEKDSNEEKPPDAPAPVPVAVAESVAQLKPYEVFEDPHDSDYRHFPNLGIWVLRPEKVS